MDSWYSEIVKPGFVLASSVAGGFVTLALAADKLARSQAKANLRNMLRGPWNNVIPSFWQSFIESVFGRKPLGLRALLVSCVFSVAICLLLNIQHAWSNPACWSKYAKPATWLQLAVTVLVINGIGDFLAIAKTRYIVDYLLRGSRSLLRIAAFFILDMVLGVAIFFISLTIIVYLVDLVYWWNLSQFIHDIRIREIARNVHVLASELRHYGIFLSGTNIFTTGAYLYSSLAATFWAIVLFLPLTSVALAQSQHFVSRQFRAFWNIDKLPFSFIGMSIAAVIFLAIFSTFLFIGTLAKASGGGRGDEVGCECTRSCSSSVR